MKYSSQKISVIFTVFLLVLMYPFTSNPMIISDGLSGDDSYLQSIDLTPIGSITIDGNDEFTKTALVLGWDEQGSRDGTASRPYIINNYALTTDTEYGIKIHNTDLYFTISNVHIDGIDKSSTGIHFDNVTHGLIEEIEITNLSGGDVSISIANSNKLMVKQSTLIGRYSKGIPIGGINVSNSSYIHITGNQITDFENGILVANTSRSYISRNKISLIHLTGIKYQDCYEIKTLNNLVFNAKFGIAQENCYGMNFFSNELRDNLESGIEIHNSIYTLAINNTIDSNSVRGVKIKVSNFTTFSGNTISNNQYTGISIFGRSWNNSVVLNNFVGNKVLPQIELIDAEDTNISENFWSDHPIIDKNNDGYVDYTYTVATGIEDQYPLAKMYTKKGLNLIQPQADTVTEGELILELSDLETSHNTRYTYVIALLQFTTSYLYLVPETLTQLSPPVGIEQVSLTINMRHYKNGQYFLVVIALPSKSLTSTPLHNLEFEMMLSILPAIITVSITPEERSNTITTKITQEITKTTFLNSTITSRISVIHNQTVKTEFTDTLVVTQTFAKSESTYPSIILVAILPLLILMKRRSKNS